MCLANVIGPTQTTFYSREKDSWEYIIDLENGKGLSQGGWLGVLLTLIKWKHMTQLIGDS